MDENNQVEVLPFIYFPANSATIQIGVIDIAEHFGSNHIIDWDNSEWKRQLLEEWTQYAYA
jgi:hypothetical protein